MNGGSIFHFAKNTRELNRISKDSSYVAVSKIDCWRKTMIKRNIIRRDYERALSLACGHGVDFDSDFHAQSVGEYLSDLAKDFGYRKPKNANGSTGRYFFQLLRRLHEKQAKGF